MGNNVGRPEDPNIRFCFYTDVEEMLTACRLDREKMEKEAKRMKKEGRAALGQPGECCEICGGNGHSTVTCVSYYDLLQEAGSDAESDGPMVCLRCYKFGDHLPENCPTKVSSTIRTPESEAEAVAVNSSCSSTLEGTRHDDTRDIIVGTATGLAT